MAYEDRFGSTEIIPDRHGHLSIAWDYEDREDDLNQRHPVLLHIPDTTESDHDHIPLTRDQAQVLHTWLGEYLKETAPQLVFVKLSTEKPAELVFEEYVEETGGRKCKKCGRINTHRLDKAGNFTCDGEWESLDTPSEQDGTASAS